MLPKIRALAVEGVTVECRESTEKSQVREKKGEVWEWETKYLDRMTYPGQFEMICYKAGDNTTLLDSSGKLKWDDLHEDNLWEWLSTQQPWLSDNPFFMSMETSFKLEVFELWILSDRCNPNNHCGSVWTFNNFLRKRLNIKIL